MQVFLPENSFADCAKVLDQKRLVKQLLEGRQIMSILANESPGGAWRNHPAVKMFVGYEASLYNYLKAIRNEMDLRGYKWENNWNVIKDTYKRNFSNQDKNKNPEWMNDYRWIKVMTTHRGRLYEKAPELYPQYKKEAEYFYDYVCCPNKCTYYWVTHKEGK